jgi:hypothetical protein
MSNKFSEIHSHEINEILRLFDSFNNQPNASLRISKSNSVSNLSNGMF